VLLVVLSLVIFSVVGVWGEMAVGDQKADLEILGDRKGEYR
jgi:hypothetical protein